jgi:TRAP-type mannitol/chloroaromatic compound transport system permease small subunit
MQSNNNKEEPVPLERYGLPMPLRFDHLTRVMNAIGTIWIFCIMLLLTADVAGRIFFNSPIRGVIEIVTISIVSIVFLQLASTAHKGKFTRADTVLHAIHGKAPRLARAIQAFFHLCAATLLAIIAVASWPSLVESWQTGEYLGAIGDFQAWVWPMRAVICFGAACAALTFLLLAIDDICRAFWIRKS